MKRIKLSALGGLFLFALLNLAACGGGDDNGANNNGGNTSPSAYPTGADANEGGAGNDSIATATSYTLGDSPINTIWPQGDQDYYEVNLTAGTDYEFFANRICATCDVYIYVYDANGIQLASDDDYIGYDSNARYTPTVSGTYYVMVRAYNSTFGVAQYTFGVRAFSDGDGDGYSSYYDCDDTEIAIYPRATEITDDGIDQNCSGVDQLANTTTDSAETDNTSATAREMTALEGYYREIQYRDEAYMDNARTLHDANDEDWFTITVAANSRVSVRTLQSTGVFSIQYLDSDAMTVLGSTLDNTTANAKTFYVRYFGSNASGAWIVQAYEDKGQDLDGDGFYSQDWGSSRDCNDADATIFTGATEIPGDGIDQNCDGSDLVVPPFQAFAADKAGDK